MRFEIAYYYFTVFLGREKKGFAPYFPDGVWAGWEWFYLQDDKKCLE